MIFKHGQKAELARRLGVNRNYLYDIMRGDRIPGRDLARRLAEETETNVLCWLFPDKYPNPLIKNAERGDAHEHPAT